MKLKATPKQLKNKNSTAINDNLADKSAQMATPLWGGYYEDKQNVHIKKLSRTLPLDLRLYPSAIESLRAQTKMCVKRNIIPEAEGRTILAAIEKVKKEFAEGKFPANDSALTVYDLLKSRICSIAGKASEWFGVASSDAAQIAGDTRLVIRDAYDAVDRAVYNIQAALIDKAEENVKAIFPGVSHSQLAQPISFGHYLMAFVEMFGRDRERIKEARSRMNESPFGSGSIAGNAFNVGRELMSRTLEFDKACSNSVDAMNSYDCAMEFGAVASICAINISRLAQEMINWHASRNAYISFSNEFVSQSEVLPYKRDPRALEMIRSKASKISGISQSINASLTAFSLEYKSDYYSIALNVIEAFDELVNISNAMSALVANFTINRKAMKEAASKQFSTAEDLVNWLMVNVGSTPNEAASTSKKIIEYAIDKGKKLSLLDLNELRKFDSKITEEIYSALIPSRAIIARRSGNGSNPVQIRKAIRAARRNYL
jgi:argininosuccinate lyase